jgi:hypothetical protein
MSIVKLDNTSATQTSRWQHEKYLTISETFNDSSRREYSLRADFKKAFSTFDLFVCDIRKMRLVEYLARYIPHEQKVVKL